MTLKRTPMPPRRTPLARTSLQRSGWAEVDRKPARRRQRDTGPTPATVATVLERDGFACSCCGLSVMGGVRGVHWSVQHRRARGMGSSFLADTNSFANLLILAGSATTGCHARVERRGADDEAAGFWLRQVTGGKPTDPTTIPVRHARYGVVLLDNAGGFVVVT